MTSHPHRGAAGEQRSLGALLLAALAAAACTRGSATGELEKNPARLLVGIVATCASTVRDVQVRRAGEPGWERAAAGTVLALGDELRTGPRSTARVTLLGGGGLDLEESTAVVLDLEPSDAARSGGRTARAAAGEGRVAVKQGVVRGAIPRASDSDPSPGLIVLSGDGSAVRLSPRPPSEAAAYRLAWSAGGTELAILRGAATVKGTRRGVVLDAGRVAVVRDGELVEPGVLAEAPRSVEPPTDARFHAAPGLAIRLRWSEVRGATGYRVQLARDPSFRDVVANEFVEGTDHVFVPAGPGLHVWRVAARDGAGRFGEYGAARRVHCEPQTPRDLLARPADGAIVRAGEEASNLTVSWEPAGEGRAYRVVLARSPDLLADQLTSVVVTGQRAILEVAKPGEYWWGVYVESDGGPRPLFTRPRRLSVSRAPPEPQAPAVDVPRSISLWGN